MKKIFLSTLLFGIAVTGVAQSKLDLRSRAALRQYQTEKVPTYNPRTKSFTASVAAPTYVGAMIKLADGASVEELQAEGVNVIRTRGNIAMVTMPVGEVERISTLKCIKSLSLSRKLSTKTDNARAAMGVDKIHSGEGLDRSYTGKGVVTGIVDAGIDANHINFRNEDGTSRIKQLSHIYATSGNISVDGSGYNVDIYEGEDIKNFTTDDEETYHGTHTMGIMAGGYKGDLKYGKGTSSLSAQVIEGSNPFYGMAPESDIIASCGDLEDMFIALGIESALDYAYVEQKPAVINLSLGSNIGPHDGTEVMSQFLDEVGKEAIICVAAGNEGLLPIALNQTFSADDKELKTFIKSQYGDVATNSGIYYNLRYGQVYIYSDDATEFAVQMVAYNVDRGTIAWRHTLSGNSEGVATYYASNDQAGDGDLTNVTFSKAFSGYAGIGSMIDENNGRYYALLDYFLCDNQMTNANGSKYIFGFVVEGKEGQRIDCYCDGLFSYMDGFGRAGWDNGSTNGSISDMACAKNILVVGAYNTRNAFTSVNGKTYTNGTYPVGQITDFSSYGTLSDGRNLPHICAPGAQIISSTSAPYMELMDAPESAYQAILTEEGRNNYWIAEKGTSMATPAVAGAVALWLEANPYLTIDEVKEIAMATATKDSYVTNFSGDPIQWGAGKFNAYEGLKEAIRLSSGVDEVIADNNRLLVKTIGEDCYNVFLGNAKEMNVAIYNVAGQSVLAASTEGDEINIDASSLDAGVYIMNVNGSHSKRILVK